MSDPSPIATAGRSIRTTGGALEQAYAEAFAEWDASGEHDLWARITADGLAGGHGWAE